MVVIFNFVIDTMAAATASPKRATTGRRVLRPLRRVGRLVSSRSSSRGAAVAPSDDDNYGAIAAQQQLDAAITSPSSLRSVNSIQDSSQRRRTSMSHDSSQQQPLEYDWAVCSVEKVLRQALLLLGAYLLGVSKPEWAVYARRLLEWCGIAWITCIVILILSLLRTKTASLPVADETMPLLPQQKELQRQASLEDVEAQDQQQQPLVLEEKTLPSPSTFTQPHPALERFYMIDRFSNERIIANSPTLHVLENDLFTGTMIAMIRTPDVDDPNAPTGSPYNTTVSDYFRDKQRRFEYQYQVKLKKNPQGRIFFACEVDESIKLGMVQRAFVGAAMAFMKKMNSAFHFSLTGGKEDEDAIMKRYILDFPSRLVLIDS